MQMVRDTHAPAFLPQPVAQGPWQVSLRRIQAGRGGSSADRSVKAALRREQIYLP